VDAGFVDAMFRHIGLERRFNANAVDADGEVGGVPERLRARDKGARFSKSVVLVFRRAVKNPGTISQLVPKFFRRCSSLRKKLHCE
jgi:hypothetical protein